MLLTPHFDPSDNTWFIPEFDVEAKSIAELQSKVPHARLEGYCPEGYKHRVEARPMAPPPRPIDRVIEIRVTLGQCREALSGPSHVDRDKVLNLWHFDGLTAAEIGERVGRATGTIENYIFEARQRNDFRAGKRQRKWGKSDVDQLKLLLSRGETVEQIARVFRTSRNAIIGKCHRLRLRI